MDIRCAVYLVLRIAVQKAIGMFRLDLEGTHRWCSLAWEVGENLLSYYGDDVGRVLDRSVHESSSMSDHVLQSNPAHVLALVSLL